ncbi:MAG: hypothetical protein KF860_17165 [Cyclobacteriaceae bacterium]|nr:hypothetical protein [Cyclobacteriaceae bacterium]
MANKKIYLEASSYQYPSRDERIKHSKRIPKIQRLEPEYLPAFIGILKNEDSEDAIRREDIHWWNNCLENRLGKLNNAYIFSLTHYERIKEDPERLTDEILLDFHLEVFYYFYFSTRDVFCQLLNVVYNLKISEEKLLVKEAFADRIPNDNIRNNLKTFLNVTYNQYGIRNSFNHRFTPTLPDQRAATSIRRSADHYVVNPPQEVSKDELINNIDVLFAHLAALLNDSINELKRSGDVLPVDVGDK